MKSWSCNASVFNLLNRCSVLVETCQAAVRAMVLSNHCWWFADFLASARKDIDTHTHGPFPKKLAQPVGPSIGPRVTQRDISEMVAHDLWAFWLSIHYLAGLRFQDTELMGWTDTHTHTHTWSSSAADQAHLHSCYRHQDTEDAMSAAVYKNRVRESEREWDPFYISCYRLYLFGLGG